MLSCPSTLPQTPPTTSISPHGCPSTVAHVCILFVPPPTIARCGRLGNLLRDLLHLHLKPTFQAPWTVTSTARPTAIRALIARSRVRARITSSSSSTTNGNGQALNGTCAGPLAREHAVVDGKVATDHVGFLGGAIAGEVFAAVGDFGAVFTVVDADFAVVAGSCAERFVEGFRPLAALADACVSGESR